MNKVEVSGRTLEEAVQLAAQELGVSVDAVEYDVEEEGSKGFLGFGQTPTVIYAWVKEGVEPGTPPAVKYGETEEEATAEESFYGVTPEIGQKPGDDSSVIAGNAMRMLEEIVKAMGVDIKPALINTAEDEITIDLAGQDVAILIGKGGQTLDALQYLLSIIANRGYETKRRITLDAEHYRERHQQMLERKALDYARAVKEKGREAVLEPQPPRDRRIIHMALAGDPEVYTYSEGAGDERHVVISPKK